MVVLSVLNKKGGVGKTTIASNLAQGLTLLGKRVLVIDNDEQHNLTDALGLSVRDCDVTLSDVMSAPPAKMENVAENAIYETFLTGLDCVVANRGLEGLRPRLSVLNEFLGTKKVKNEDYDVVIIDNSPTVTVTARCAILCSNYFILPVELRQFSINGVREMYNMLKEEYKVENDRIYIVGNKYRDIRQFKSNYAAIRAIYPENTLKTLIPEDMAFENTISENKSMFLSRTTSKGTMCFHDLICEVFDYDRSEMLEIFENRIVEYKKFNAGIALKKARIINLSKKEAV